MVSEWENAAIGDVLNQVKRPILVDDLDQVGFAGVRWYAEGVYHRESLPAREVKTKLLQRIELDDIVYNRMWATKASFGRVKEDAVGCLVTNDFPIFVVDPGKTLPAFVELLFQQPAFQEAASLAATGTTERRRLSERDFKRIPISLPPWGEQLRIVDLIGSVDDVLVRLTQRLESSKQLFSKYVSSLFLEGKNLRLDEIVDIQVGFPFKSTDFVESGVRLLRGDNISPGELRWSDAKCLDHSLVDTRVASYYLDENDVVLAMDRPVISAGTKTSRVTEDDLPALLVQRVARLRSQVSRGSEAVGIALQSNEFREHLVRVQTGAHAPHISKKNISDFHMPASLLLEQTLELAESLELNVRRAAESVIQIRKLRSELLSALLSGAHRIPETYDKLMGA